MESRKDWSSSTIEISVFSDNTASGGLLAATPRLARARLNVASAPKDNAVTTQEL